MTPTRRQTYLEIERTGLARWEALKRLVLAAFFVCLLFFMFMTCRTSKQSNVQPPERTLRHG